jgi:hypothetical protein
MFFGVFGGTMAWLGWSFLLDAYSAPAWFLAPRYEHANVLLKVWFVFTAVFRLLWMVLLLPLVVLAAAALLGAGPWSATTLNRSDELSLRQKRIGSVVGYATLVVSLVVLFAFV